MRIAVTGASGTVGGQVVDLLATDVANDIIAVSRRPPNRPLPANVSVTSADYADPRQLRAAFKDIDTLVFISSDGPAANVMLHHQNVVWAAQAVGVGHVVALSGVDADLASPFCYAVTNGRTEQLLSESGMPHSIVRASIYGEFFDSAFLADAKTAGTLRIPAGDGRVALVARTDVAHALATLALGGPTGQHHDITGAQALDGPTIAAIASTFSESPIEYVDVTPSEYALANAHNGLDPWWAYAFSSMFASVREQRWNVVSDDFEQLTGRAPTRYSPGCQS